LYTKEPSPTDKKILPVEPENIPEEFKARSHPDWAEQLSLFSTDELAELQRPSDARPPQGEEIPPPETALIQRPRRLRGCAVQLKLPGF
jgi:hypothetical protein